VLLGREEIQRQFPKDIWLAKSGFGGTEYLLSGLMSEGSKRGMSYNHMAELLAWNPAQRYGLLKKGDIDAGYDADLVLVDEKETFVVRAAESESRQGYTPFEGQALTGRVKQTFLRGSLVLRGRQDCRPGDRTIHSPPAEMIVRRGFVDVAEGQVHYRHAGRNVRAACRW
jgi:allantoinase